MLPLLLVPLLLPADDAWTVFRSGPLEVLTTGGAKQARDALTRLEQFRHVFGAALSRPELNSVWPIRVVMLKGPRPATSPSFTLARDAWVAGLAPGEPVPPRWLRQVGRILLDSNAGRMPEEIEEALLDLYSTLDIQVTRITLGAPPPPAGRSPLWPRLHLLATDPQYSGRLRVLLNNLQQGMESDPAHRNAFGKTARELDKEITGAPATISLSGRPLDPEFTFPARPAEPALARVIWIDLMPPDTARAAYEALPDSAEAHEGLGFLDLRAGKTEDARKHFARAIELGSRNARVHLQAGALESAAKLNPRWAEPYLRMAAREQQPRRRIPPLAMAAKLDPRNASTWRALAEAQFEAKMLAESARSWIAAERAAPNETERAQIRAARLEAEQRRLDAEVAERKRLADEKERELLKLKNEALERIRLAEAKARERNQPLEPGHKVEEWWDDPAAPRAKAQGKLERVDCTAGSAILHLRTVDGKLLRLLIRDPAQVVIEGGGERSLACGPQKPARALAVDYVVRADPKAGTAGEAAVVQFQ